jgi:hypothetical protein
LSSLSITAPQLCFRTTPTFLFHPSIRFSAPAINRAQQFNISQRRRFQPLARWRTQSILPAHATQSSPLQLIPGICAINASKPSPRLLFLPEHFLILFLLPVNPCPLRLLSFSGFAPDDCPSPFPLLVCDRALSFGARDGLGFVFLYFTYYCGCVVRCILID